MVTPVSAISTLVAVAGPTVRVAAAKVSIDPSTVREPWTSVTTPVSAISTLVAVEAPKRRVVAVLASRASVVMFSTASRGP